MDVSNIDTYIKRGQHDRYWYQETETLFRDLYGPDPDRRKLVAQVFAATSINTSLKANVTLFRRALHELDTGKPFSNYLPNIRQQLTQIREGKRLTGNKIRAFAAAMSGDSEAVVVDVWLLRAFGMDRKYYRQGSQTFRSGGATDRQFELIEFYVRERAHAMGIQPRELSAIIWSGVRNDRLTRYDLVLRHKVYSMFDTFAI